MPDLTAIYRDALAAIHDALDIPPAALGGEHDHQRAILLERRLIAVTNATSAVLNFTSEDLVRDAIGYLRDRTSQTPVRYRRFVAAADEHPGDCIVCGPGCCAPVLGVHMSCPGPAAGRTVVSVR